VEIIEKNVQRKKERQDRKDAELASKMAMEGDPDAALARKL
jgi:hypothetical protein